MSDDDRRMSDEQFERILERIHRLDERIFGRQIDDEFAESEDKFAGRRMKGRPTAALDVRNELRRIRRRTPGVTPIRASGWCRGGAQGWG